MMYNPRLGVSASSLPGQSGCSSMVELLLPKQIARVRFPSAPPRARSGASPCAARPAAAPPHASAVPPPCLTGAPHRPPFRSAVAKRRETAHKATKRDGGTEERGAATGDREKEAPRAGEREKETQRARERENEARRAGRTADRGQRCASGNARRGSVSAPRPSPARPAPPGALLRQR